MITKDDFIKDVTFDTVIYYKGEIVTANFIITNLSTAAMYV